MSVVGLLPEHNLLLSSSIVVSLIIFVVVEQCMNGISISCTNELLRKTWQITELLSFFLFIFLCSLFWFSRDANCTLFDATSTSVGFSLVLFLLIFSIFFILLSITIYEENDRVSEQDSKNCGNTITEATKGLIKLLIGISFISSLVLTIILGIQLYRYFMV